MTIRRLFLLMCLPLVSTGCVSSWWKPEQLYRLNRGPASMNEEAYYSIPAARAAGEASSDDIDVPEPFSPGRDSAPRPVKSR